MPTSDWPSREVAERWEIQSFISFYRRFPEHRVFEIAKKRERPDWLLRDVSNGEYVAVELTSVYENERSVPDVHMREGLPFWSGDIAAYGQRVAEAVATKVRKARTGYDVTFPLLLSVYANEYVTFRMFKKEWDLVIKEHEPVFDDMAPFAEVIIWPLPNESVLRIRPAQRAIPRE